MKTQAPQQLKATTDVRAEAMAPLASRAARIQDVARLAQVSTATVSRTLSEPERVSPAARARVMEAIAQLGYLPNSAARSLRSQKARMVLVVLPDLSNSFFSEILQGIEDRLFEAGYGMIIGNLDGSPEKEARFAAFTATGQVDGALLLNGHLFGQTRDGHGEPMKTNVPLVALCEAIPGTDIPQIDVENRAAAREMTLYLAGLGHRTIAYVCGPAGNVLETERFGGYREGLEAAGLSFNAKLVFPGDYTLEAGIQVGRILLKRDARPTAVFCSNDEMAIGLIRTLASGGVRVPRDISVAGFDDIVFAAMADPPLTTVRQPRRELGRKGAAVLLDRLAGQGVAKRTQLRTELVVRASTASPPAAGGRKRLASLAAPGERLHVDQRRSRSRAD